MTSKTEIIIGITSQLGALTDKIESSIIGFFKQNNFRCVNIHVSEVLTSIANSLIQNTPSGIEKISVLQDIGDLIRMSSDMPEILMIHTLKKIQKSRSNSYDKTLYIIKSFKHPKEVELMRHVYGDSFFLIGCFAPYTNRLLSLKKTFPNSDEKTLINLMQKDHNRSIDKMNFQNNQTATLFKETAHNKNVKLKIEHTQKVEQTLHLSDLFLNIADSKNSSWIISRFLKLLLADPFITPTKEEMCMFIAKSYALRSNSIDRQVGCVIADDCGNIVSMGCNEVPKFGGNCYWSSYEGEDNRDFLFFKKKSLENISESYIISSIKSLRQMGWNISHDHKNKKHLINDIKSTKIAQSHLFRSRDTHAEMSALMDAALRGVPTKNMYMFCTTFPCHNCAKHILSAGIRKVTYIEPYPKSEALNLWPNEITVNESHDKLILSTFTGISPNIFFKFFQPVLDKKRRTNGQLCIYRHSPTQFRNNYSKWEKVCPVEHHKSMELAVLNSTPYKGSEIIQSFGL